MTYSSMLRSLPAPLQSILREPTALTVLASIGVHGLLWATLPFLPLMGQQPTEAEIQREVGLVELSPDELARVPQFDSQASIPLPEAPPLPPANAGRSPQQFSLTPLPTPPPFPSVLPPSLYIPPLDRSPIILPPTTLRPRSTTPTTRQPSRPTPTPTRPPTPAATPTPTTPTTSSPQAASPTPSPTPTLEDRDPFSQTPEPNPTATATPSLEGATGTPEAQPTEPAQSEASPSASPTPQRATREEIARQREQERERDRVAALLTPYPEGSVPTSRGRADVAFGNWFYRGNEGRTLGDLRKVEISVRYPAEACPIRATATVVYGVDVNADDRIVGDPQRLFSSRYPVFDEAALAAVRDYNFNNTTSEEQPYQVTVTFPYSAEACGAAPEEPPAS